MLHLLKGEKYSHLISWKELQAVMPWNVILLIGRQIIFKIKLVISENFAHFSFLRWWSSNCRRISSYKEKLAKYILFMKLNIDFKNKKEIRLIRFNRRRFKEHCFATKRNNTPGYYFL
jgi:hypothetical protein